MSTLSIVVGDATKPVHAAAPAIVAHVCNDRGGWGSGFTAAVSRRWPLAEQRYRNWHSAGEGFGLGSLQTVQVAAELWVANMVAQSGYRSRANPVPLVHAALEECLRSLTAEASRLRASVHMPRIGCGLAGGHWSDIEPLILATLVAGGVGTTIYDLPPSGSRG